LTLKELIINQYKLSVMNKKVMYVGIALLGFGMFMGHIITSIIFFGILSAASLVVLVESNKRFKLFCGKYGFLLDLLLFVLSAMAVAYMGVTVAGGLAVASLIFTVYRINFLKPWYDKVKESVAKTSVKETIAKVFNQVYDIVCDGWKFMTQLFNSKKQVLCVAA
jgi:hypothetical protein